MQNKNSFDNDVKCGFFLEIGNQNKFYKLSKKEAFLHLLANAFLNLPLEKETNQQIALFKKIGILLEKCEFYKIVRTEDSSFDMNQIKQIIYS